MHRLLLTFVAWFTAISVLCTPYVVEAHPRSLSSIEGRIDGREVHLTVRLAGEDLADPLGMSPLLVPTLTDALRHPEAVVAYLSERIDLHNGDEKCTPTSRGTEATPRESGSGFVFAAVMDWNCAHRADALVLDSSLLFDLDPSHKTSVRVELIDHRVSEGVLDRANHSISLSSPTTRWQIVRAYVWMGIEHIVTGYDHLAFVLCLLMGVFVLDPESNTRRRVATLAGVITAFTLAHSVSLGAAALGLVHLPPKLVESAIAGSIVYVGFENAFKAVPRGRFALTFAFGLLHGLGFAGALAEVGLPTHGTATALVAFNVGVELGQLAVIVLALPTILMLFHRRESWGEQAGWLTASAVCVIALSVGMHAVGVSWTYALGGPTIVMIVWCGGTARWGFDRGARRGGSVLVALFAVIWLGERLTDSRWFGGVLG